MENRVILDIGAHDGKDTLYYASRGFKVIAYEANPGLCAEITEKARIYGEKIEVRNRAISDKEGNLDFYINRFNTTWSSLDQDLGSRREGAEKILVPSARLEEEVKGLEGQIYYAKIDIEGFDEVALKQLLRLNRPPRYVSVENGSVNIIEQMEKKGYSKFFFSNQKYVYNQRIPINTKYSPITHTFEKGASGLFGTDLVGRWMSSDEAKNVCKGLTDGRAAAPNNLWAEVVGWFDLHARLAE